jgi:hypothetical protein
LISYEAVASHQRDWDAKLPIFLLAYRAFHWWHYELDPSQHTVQKGTPTALQPAIWGNPKKEWPTVDYTANLLDLLPDIHNYARQCLKLASDQMKTRYDWPTVRATMRVTTCRSITPSPWKESHPSYNPHGRAHTG